MDVGERGEATHGKASSPFALPSGPASPHRAIIENMFQVVDRDRRTVPFLLTETQAHLDSHWTRRNLVCKIRQHAAISSYVIAKFTAKCLAEENRSCVLVSHEAEATARLLNRAKFIIDHLRHASPPKITTDRSNALVFGNTGSSFWIGTAGQRSFGRGDTISDLHLSEAAFYDDPERIRDGLFPAAENGEITIESTGNGRGNWFHQMAQAARDGSGFQLFFYPWRGLASCSLALSPESERILLGSLNPVWEEPELYADGVSLSQLAWRRERITSDYGSNLERFKENYPLHFEECFRPAGLSFFPKARFRPTQAWQQHGLGHWRLEGHPAPGHRYVAGADVGGGVKQDNSVLCIFDIDLQEQVCEWTSNTIAPDEAGHVWSALCQEFNNAYLNVERNNHGLTTISVLTSHYPLDRLHRGTYSVPQSQVALTHISNYGTYISETTRGLLLGTARALLTEWTIHSDQLNDELTTFIESRTGKFEAGAGSHDDRVFAACHALYCIERASIMTQWDPPPPLPRQSGFTLDDAGNIALTFDALFPDAGAEPKSQYGISRRYG